MPLELLFDLDGTLTDPAVGIFRCIQYALSKLGRTPRPETELRRFIGPPLRQSFATLLETDDRELIELAVNHYRERFSETGIYENRLYDDVPGGLADLRDDGHRLWVVTSKPSVYARRIIDYFSLGNWFEAVYGSELSGENSQKIDLIGFVLDKEAIRSDLAVMIGDRAEDVVGARLNGVRTVAVRWGYGSDEELETSQPDALVSSMADLRGQLNGAS
jgi:phosphoglycolate phosphatase